MRARYGAIPATIGMAFIIAACGDSTGGGNPPPETTTTFEGVIAGDSASGLLSGKLTLTISTASLRVVPPVLVADVQGTAASVSVTGMLTLMGGTVVDLSGTYDTGAHTLSIAGGGYAFNGSFADGALSGTFTTPGGASGSFSTSSGSSAASPVYAFCGTATATAGNGGATLNIVVNTGSGIVSGFAVGNHDPGPTHLAGTASGSSWSLTFTTNKGHAGTASGTFTPTTFSGSYSIPQDPESGTVTGTICH